MLIGLVTFGSRGDVQPYVALGVGLRAAGYSVRLCTHPGFEQFVRSSDLDFHPVEGNPTSLMAGLVGERIKKAERNPLEFAAQIGKTAGGMMAQLLHDSWEGLKDTDALIFSVTGWYAAHHIMEKRGIQGVAAYLQPVNTTAEFPSFFTPFPNIKGWFNRTSYRLAQEVGWPYLRPFINAARQQVLGLPPMGWFSPFPRLEQEQAFPVLYGFSPSLVPKPVDWAETVEVCGFWFLPPKAIESPSQKLVDFIQSGDPPVYIGFGSMREREPQKITDIGVAALQKAGMRGIVLINHSPVDLPEGILALDTAPHEWLFPRCAAVVHHAGAGTCAAALRAGVPSVTVPNFADQPFWADRLYRCGAGTRPIPRRGLTVDRLTRAIEQTVKDQKMHSIASKLGEKIRAEDGVARAVEAIQRMLR